MSMTKIDYCMNLIEAAIYNMVVAKIDPHEIAIELLATHRSELKLYDVAPEMQIVWLEGLANMAWYTMYKEHYKTI